MFGLEIDLIKGVIVFDEPPATEQEMDITYGFLYERLDGVQVYKEVTERFVFNGMEDRKYLRMGRLAGRIEIKIGN